MSGRRREGMPRTVTARAMSILASFSQEHPVLGLADISRRTGLSSSTTHRLVSELTEWGALARTGHFQYRIGPMLRRLSTIALSDPAQSSPIYRNEESGHSGCPEAVIDGLVVEEYPA